MTSMRLLPIFLLLSALVLAPAAASADDWPLPPLQVAQSGCKSLSQAVEQIRRQTGGRILSAETRTRNGREVHHIKVLTSDNKVKTHKVQGCRRGG